MDFELSEAQSAIRREVVDFARARLGEHVAEHDRDGVFPREDWQRCADFGVLGWPVPTEHGGSGYDPLTTMIALEALGYGCVDNGLVFAINNHLWGCVIYLLEHGTDDQRARYLKPLCGGRLVGAHALSEPEAGSDVLNIQTTAVRDGDHYVLNGTKWFISNGPTAGLYVVFARTGGPGREQDRLSAFLVPADLPGVQRGQEFSKMGLRTTEMGAVTFADCRVPVEDRLGREGAGYSIFTSTVEWERSFMFANQVGAMERLLERSVDHVATRRQFGRPIGALQAVAHKIADMKIRLELARLILYRVGWLKTNGRLSLVDTTIAKVFVSESLVQTAMAAVEVHGARGYVSDHGIERELRDALGGPIYAGSSSVQRGILAELIGVRGGLTG
ncbi:acyl-CoA dehydrogenase [Lentzea guizhouensis]|uniref:Acyl-CoA dehydrogenase n=1 Tax=Lentzea guizhouensis TaxID=1586287 RepID=A0A1B2HS00_9PSEU|nr:acyl-CoA dehydrogenase family protein [Lentzea guizhouensis]ANZ40536.1 acyl-CoA dehydrogenase [Lentzea guizhouensis]